MGVLTAAPKSFKVDRKSSFASKLKSLIFDRLLCFCPEYADDVLAEYITVLMCNGKNQYQARDDLEAFLGERSEEFVSWLWRILSKYDSSLSANLSSDRKGKASIDTYEENGNRNGKISGQQSHGKSLSDNLTGKGQEEIHCLSAKTRKSYDMPSELHHSQSPKEKISWDFESSGPHSKSVYVEYSPKEDSSICEYQSESVHFEEPSSLPRRYPGSLQENVPVSEKHSDPGIKLSEPPRMHCKAAASERSISPFASSHDYMPRRSVWDRLGKTQDVLSIGQTVDFDALGESHCMTGWVDQHPPVIQKHEGQIVRLSPLLPLCTNSQGDDVVDTIPQVPSVSNSRRKRHFGDLTSLTNDVAVEVAPQPCNRPEVSLEASQVVDSVSSVKLRLRQIEIEMTKLRSKQIEMEKDGKTKLLMNHDMKATEEDIDSRTVLVTNVHFKATKEALSMYFGKCGAAVNVVILTDYKPFTSQRSAYITFGSKESADKALGFSGTTFYSRTILVSRKGEKSGVSSAQLSGRSQVHASRPMCSLTSDRSSLPGSHLQWHRVSITSTHSEAPASNTELIRATSGSASQQKLSPSSASDQYEDSKQCIPAASADQISEAEL